VRDNSKITGYAVGRYVVKEKVPCFGVLDFCILEGYERHSSVLLSEIEKLAIKQNAELMLIMMLKRYAKKFGFHRNGWFRTPYNFSFIVKNAGNLANIDKLVNENNWYLTWIDSDDL
jgi:hypothetical protein